MNSNLIKPPYLATSLQGRQGIEEHVTQHLKVISVTSGIWEILQNKCQWSSRNKWSEKNKKGWGTYRLRETFETCQPKAMWWSSVWIWLKSTVKTFLIQLGKMEHRLGMTCMKEGNIVNFVGWDDGILV